MAWPYSPPQSSGNVSPMKQTYNILFVFPLPFIPERGGVERVTDMLARELAARGHRIFYLHRPAKRGRDVCYGDYAPPASVHYLPQRKLSSRQNIQYYHRFLKEHQIHFIINQMGISKNYCPFTHVPKNNEGFPKGISALHTNPLVNYEQIGNDAGRPGKKGCLSALGDATRRLMTPLRKWSYKNKRLRELRAVARSSDAMCVLSSAFCCQLESLGVMRGSACILRAIGNPCAFEPVKEIPDKRRQLVYVGRLEPVQNSPQRLIPIWRKICDLHPDWELIFVGDGPCRKAMQEDAADLPRIRFEGYHPPAPYFRDAAISCLTSTIEGFGLVLLEAMCHGSVPVAFNSFPVLGELLEGHMDKLAARPFDTEDFADKLSWLISHEEERRKLAEACIAKSAEYTPAAITNRWESLFAELAGKA